MIHIAQLLLMGPRFLRLRVIPLLVVHLDLCFEYIVLGGRGSKADVREACDIFTINQANLCVAQNTIEKISQRASSTRSLASKSQISITCLTLLSFPTISLNCLPFVRFSLFLKMPSLNAPVNNS
jgi:hypothetical protein